MSDTASRFLPGQTALLIEVPELTPAVGRWRAEFDPSAALGVGPHVTILFPFLPMPALTPADRADLAGIAGAEARFTVSFRSFGVFAGTDPAPPVLHLVPNPDDPFRRLTAAVAARWPRCPPYGGTIDDPTPHLTVTETATATEIEAARRAVGPLLPISATAGCVTLIAFDGSSWRPEASFPLGRSAPAPAPDRAATRRPPSTRRPPARRR
jgi:2'-5' RNA ligase